MKSAANLARLWDRKANSPQDFAAARQFVTDYGALSEKPGHAIGHCLRFMSGKPAQGDFYLCADIMMTNLQQARRRSPALRLMTACHVPVGVQAGLTVTDDALAHIAEILDDPKNLNRIKPDLRARGEMTLAENLGIEDRRGWQAAQTVLRLIKWDRNDRPRIPMADKQDYASGLRRLGEFANAPGLVGQLKMVETTLEERQEAGPAARKGSGLFFPFPRREGPRIGNLERALLARDAEAFEKQSSALRLHSPDEVLETALKGIAASRKHDEFWETCVAAIQNIVARPKLVNMASPVLTCHAIGRIFPECVPEARWQLCDAASQVLARSDARRMLGEQRYENEVVQTLVLAAGNEKLFRKMANKAFDYIETLEGNDRLRATKHVCTMLPFGSPLLKKGLNLLMQQIRMDGGALDPLDKLDAARYASQTYIDQDGKQAAYSIYAKLSRQHRDVHSPCSGSDSSATIFPLPHRPDRPKTIASAP